MTPAAHAPNCDCRQCQLAMVARLEDLRDALVGLSLALSDWQFEVDRMGRRDAQVATKHLIEQLGLTNRP
jgi:hypothetical protein